tara:strand:+ start:6757 stop:7152 length:396 start_codon:yes stop_codon:yes gene_type:complete
MLFYIIKFIGLAFCFSIFAAALVITAIYWYKNNKTFKNLINKIIQSQKIIWISVGFVLITIILAHMVNVIIHTHKPSIVKNRQGTMLCYRDAANNTDQKCRTATKEEIKYLKPLQKYDCGDNITPQSCVPF